MAFEKVSDHVRHLIRENDPRAAADLLAQSFRDKNPQLFNIALVQQSNIKKLADQSAAGILSPDEMNREQAKTNAALLHLSDEYTRLYEGAAPAPGTGIPRWVLPAAAAVLALVLIGWLANKSLSSTNSPKTFDVEVSLVEKGAESLAISEGEVNLRLGEAEPQERHPLDAAGKATFKDLSEKYRDSMVHLLYFPPRNRRFNVSQQSATTLTGRDQLIRFTVEFLPDTTVLEATLTDAKGQRIAGAQITVDGKIQTQSDANGYFQVIIPKAVGTELLFVVEKNRNRIFRQSLAIWAGHKEFSI